MFQFRRPVKIHAHYGAMILGRLMYWLTLPLRLLDMPYWLVAKGLEILEAKIFGKKYIHAFTHGDTVLNKMSFLKFIFDAIFRWPVLLVFGKADAILKEMLALENKIKSSKLQLAFRIFTAPIWLPYYCVGLIRIYIQGAILSLFSWNKSSFMQGIDMTLPQLLSTLLILTAMRLGGLVGCITGSMVGIFNNKKLGQETQPLQLVPGERWFLSDASKKFTAFDENFWLGNKKYYSFKVEARSADTKYPASETFDKMQLVEGDEFANIFEADRNSTALVTMYSQFEKTANSYRGEHRQPAFSCKITADFLRVNSLFHPTIKS